MLPLPARHDDRDEPSGAVVLPVASAAPPDAELVRRALAGDRWAESAIYQRHAPMVANLAGRLLARHADALDVLQDVFVEALAELGSLRDPAALRPWLLRRTVRRVGRVLRARRWRRLVGLDRGSDDLTLEAMASPELSPEARLELRRIGALLASLPERQRTAWILHHVEGETLPAVAEACGVSLATAKREIAAARVTLDVHVAKGNP